MRKTPRILLIEDESGLVMTLTDRLQSAGYTCESESDGIKAFELAQKGSWDLILLDVMLPGKNGFEICSELRDAKVRTPIMMLTAREQVSDRVMGLKLGADDYLCKPFDMAELLARVNALLRRSHQKREKAGWEQACEKGRLDFGNFSVDFSKCSVQREGQEVPLSGQEFKLLAYLCENQGQIISRERLLANVWDYDNDVSTRTVDVHVAWLRRKIGDLDPIPRHIQTVRGLGYRFEP